MTNDAAHEKGSETLGKGKKVAHAGLSMCVWEGWKVKLYVHAPGATAEYSHLKLREYENEEHLIKLAYEGTAPENVQVYTCKDMHVTITDPKDFLKDKPTSPSCSYNSSSSRAQNSSSRALVPLESEPFVKTQKQHKLDKEAQYEAQSADKKAQENGVSKSPKDETLIKRLKRALRAVLLL